jgi:hypothetical protein
MRDDMADINWSERRYRYERLAWQYADMAKAIEPETGVVA